MIIRFFRCDARCVCWGLILLLAACGQSDPAATGAGAASVAKAGQRFHNYTERGDLPALKKRGVLRLLAPRRDTQGLPRDGLPAQSYRDLAEKFARSLGLKPEWIIKDSLEDLIPALNAGEGDLIVDNLTHTQTREAKVSFSLPISRARERILTPAGAKKVNKPADLMGLSVVVPKGSSYAESLRVFRHNHPSVAFTLVVKPLDGNPDTLVDLINGKKFDATVLDDNVAKTLKQYRSDYTLGLAVSKTRPVGWATRQGTPQLLSALNRFLTQSMVTRSRRKAFTGDFSAIKKRQVLRMITRNSPASYFMWRGELMGFEYDLLHKFARDRGLRLEVEVAPPGVDMIDWLQQGHGDVIAAGMTVTAKRAKRVAFTRFYDKVSEQLVTSSGAKPLASPADLAGRTLVINPQHAYWQTAKKLQQKGTDFTLQKAPAGLSSSDILQGVSAGRFDATIIDSDLVAIESQYVDNLQPGYQFTPARHHAWAVRKSNPELLVALNHFLSKEYRGLFFNITYNKYFANPTRIDKYQAQQLARNNGLSPYDNLVKPLGQKYHFDWRMLVAQMYQESRFSPKARSFAGARGLLQVMPRTAKELGYKLPLTPQTGLAAGVKYLDWTRDRFESYLPLDQRLWFALAAYNAGYGHVYDARRLAEKKGWDPDVWFDNVERAMQLLSKRRYFSQARFGYVRGSEPVKYVRSIRDRYYGYLAVTP